MARIKTKFITENAVTNPKLAQVATQTIKGRATAGTGDVEDLSSAQATAILDVMVGDTGAGGTKGLVPAPAAGDATKYLRGDGTYATPGAFTGDIIPTTWSGLANNTPNQSITGLSFASSIYSFEAFLSIYIDATTDLYTTVKIVGTRMSAIDWSVKDCQVEFSGSAIPGLSFDIAYTGQVTITIGSVTGFTSGQIMFRATAL